MLRRWFAAGVVFALAAGCSGGGGNTEGRTSAGSSFTCSDTQFLHDQSAFAAGTIHADQFEQICGTVTSVLAAARTGSGTHGYFYLRLAAPSNEQIEIVANLDAMAEAPTGDPPATWPWVSSGLAGTYL